MKIEKLPSGSYRFRKKYNNKTYTVVVDYKPTHKEAIALMAEKMRFFDISSAKNTPLTFSKAYSDYLELKSNILSPATKKGYKIVYNRISEDFKNMRLSDITSVDVQKEINNDAVDHAPKSVKNFYGLISIVLKTYRKDLILDVQLPQAIKKEPYIPTDEEVKAVLNKLRDTQYYVAACLATMSLRRSEICALTLNDLSDDNILTINKAKVETADNDFVIKTTKTTESTREILIPDELADLIRKQGYIYNGFPNSLTRALNNAQDKLGIQRFSIHKLRHFFATYAHNELHLSDKQIMQIGGWKTTSVLNTVYKHSTKAQETREIVSDKIGSLF